MGIAGHGRALQTVQGDLTSFSSGSYSSWMNPFGATALTSNVTFLDRKGVTSGRFPNDTTFTWTYPNVPASGVYGFLQLSYGDYLATSPPTPITPAILRNVVAMTTTHCFAISGNAQGHDVIYDYFLTSTPGSTSSNWLYEISVWMHTPTFSTNFFNTATPIGNVFISGVLWKTAILTTNTPQYIMVQPVDGLDKTNLTFDHKALWDFLISMGIITPVIYFNGLGFGIEPRSSYGSMYVYNFSANYAYTS